MMAQLDKAAAAGKNVGDTPPTPKTPETPPAAKPEDDKPAATPPAAPAAAKPATTPASPAKPAADEMNETAMEEFLKKHPKPWRVYEASKKKWQTEKQSLESRIAEISNKPAPTAADDRKLEALTKQLEEYRGESSKYKQELVKRDYTQSDDYKKNFVEKVNTIYTEAVGFVQQLRVNQGDGERVATQADFDELRALPLGARRKAAVDKFGDYANDVLSFVRDIDVVKRDANLAVQRHAEQNEKESAERETMTAKQRQEYEGYYRSSLEGIQKNESYGKWFSENPDDPEATQLLKSGFEEIDKISAQLDTLPPDQQAAYSAVFKARAAAFPRLLLEHARLLAKQSELEAELAKYRGTDPGAEAGAGGDGLQPTKRMNTDAAAAAFDEAPRN
jgi:hypothetical protein